MSTTTTNMLLTKPAVQNTPGPTWATEMNTTLDLIDSHDHSTGEGVKVTPAGLNINADLEFNANDATELRTARFENNAAAITGSSPDLNCAYVAAGDLYFNDASGNQVQITSSGGINAAGIGAIGGDYATSTASLNYSDSTKSFTFLQSTNTTAKILSEAITIYKAGTGTNGNTIQHTGSSTITTTLPNITGTLATLANTAQVFAGAVTVTGTLTGSGRVLVDDTTDATTATDGSLQTDGGLSVAKKAYIGNILTVILDDAVTGVSYPITIKHTASDDGEGNNDGVGIQFVQSNDAQSEKTIATIEAIATDVTSTAEEGAIVFKTMKAGAAATEDARIANGGMTMPRNEGLVVQYISATTVDIDADYLTVFNSSNLGKVLSSVNLTIDIATTWSGSTISGDGGLMEGLTEGNKWYYIWIIWDGTNTKCILTESATAIATMPTGYTFKKFVGAVYNSAGDFRSFSQTGKISHYTGYNTYVLSAGTSTSFVAINLSAEIPPSVCESIFSFATVNRTSSTTQQFIIVSPDGNNSQYDFGYYDNSGVTDGDFHAILFIPLMSTVETVLGYPSIYYKTVTGNSVNLGIRGFVFKSIY